MPHKILCFEDTVAQRKNINAALQKVIGSKDEVVFFRDGASPSSRPDGTYEDSLLAELKKDPYKGSTLIVTDRDLSTIPKYVGLSDAAVSAVADELGIPVCKYTRGKSEVFDRARRWGENQIILTVTAEDAMAKEIMTIAEGFSEIAIKLKEIEKNTKLKTPAAMMAGVLGHPELADRIALYGSGDQRMLMEVMPFVAKGERKEFRKRLPCMVGYWLYESILRFPGILVNAVAAASYLNISAAEFLSNKKIQSTFKSAIYSGPFSDKAEPRWWRHMLDKLVGDCLDGNEFATKKVGSKVPPCRCSIDNKSPAGWYCMVTQKPVSERNSAGGISWFPPGADLARINRKDYDEVAPWLGLF